MEPMNSEERENYLSVKEENSIENQIFQSNNDMEDEIDENDFAYKLQKLELRVNNLRADQEILKENLLVRQQEVLTIYQQLFERKQILLDLVVKSYNEGSIELDIGLFEEFQELKKVIDGQKATIQRMREDISKQGLSGGNNDESYMKIKNKIEEMEKEIKVGRKYSSTQYVRDYLERPLAYKVSYEDVKYQYELRLRLKESLENQKKLYQQRKAEINVAKKKQREIQQELQMERDSLLK